jgi:hypothetical protein
MYNWFNTSSEPCLIAFALISAHPVKVNGKVLEAHG